MKKLSFFYLLSMCLVSWSAFSQSTSEGVVIYERVVDIHANLAPEQLIYKSMIPQFQKETLEMSFKNEKALLDKKEEKGGSTPGMSVQSFGSGTGKIIMDAKKGVTREFTEIGKEKFYTEEKPIATSDYKKTGKSKTIGGYKCFEIVNEEKSYWYTSELPKNFSPIGLIDVNGMVLEYENRESKTKMIFKGINLKSKVEDSKFEIPKDYMKVSEDQLEDLQDDYIEGLIKN